MENFDEYIRQGEPNKAEKAKVWKTAIGLQQVDGLTPSDYFDDCWTRMLVNSVEGVL